MIKRFSIIEESRNMYSIQIPLGFEHFSIQELVEKFGQGWLLENSGGVEEVIDFLHTDFTTIEEEI